MLRIKNSSPCISSPMNIPKIKTKDTYRPLFCKPDFYLQNRPYFRIWKNLFENLTIDKQVQAWVIGLCLLRRPTDWFAGKQCAIHQFDLNHSNHSNHSISLKSLCEGTPLIIPKHIDSEIDLIQLVNNFRIKPLPLTIQRSLVMWANGKYNIQVLQNIPSATEVLNFQINQCRILSFEFDFSKWAGFNCNGRDFLSFMLHDLVHADHFFHLNTQLLGQIGFYHCARHILNSKVLIELLKNNEFQNQFEYLISDMNAHPVHLFKTLQALVSQKINDKELLKNTWNHWVTNWINLDLMHQDIDIEPSLFAALQNINQAAFSNQDALEVEKFAIALGHNKVLA